MGYWSSLFESHDSWVGWSLQAVLLMPKISEQYVPPSSAGSVVAKGSIVLDITTNSIGPIPQFGFAVPLEKLQSTAEPVFCPTCDIRAITTTGGSSLRKFTTAVRSCSLASRVVEHRCGHCDILLARWRRSSGLTVVVAEQSKAVSPETSTNGVSHAMMWAPSALYT